MPPLEQPRTGASVIPPARCCRVASYSPSPSASALRHGVCLAGGCKVTPVRLRAAWASGSPRCGVALMSSHVHAHVEVQVQLGAWACLDAGLGEPGWLGLAKEKRSFFPWGQGGWGTPDREGRFPTGAVMRISALNSALVFGKVRWSRLPAASCLGLETWLSRMSEM
jgi:hypothetical protein